MQSHYNEINNKIIRCFRMTHLPKIFCLVIFLTLANPEMHAASALDLELPDNNHTQCVAMSRGKHFVLGFIDNYDSLYLESRQLFIWLVAFSHQETTATISSKHETDGVPFQETFVIEGRGFIRTNVPVELVMENTERSNKVLEISASSDVSAYGLMSQYRTSGGYLGIPTNNLGMQYVVTTSPGSRGNQRSQFAVIGTENSTLVQVTLRGAVTFEGNSYDTGDVLRFTVNSSEAVQIQGQRLVDLTGSIIQSDKPVAVYSGNECTYHTSPNCDTVTEQLIPVKSWGQKHIYTTARSEDYNIYRIVAYFSETNLTIPGFQQQSLGPGEFWEGRLTGSGLVTSGKPALMMQHLASINGRTVDPAMIQVPAVEQFGFVFGFTTPPHSRADSGGYFNFISIIVKKGSRRTINLNAAPISDTMIVNETDVPNTSYISLTVQVPKGEGVYYVEQTDPFSSPLSVIVYGYESGDSYGYSAGLSLPVCSGMMEDGGLTPSTIAPGTIAPGTIAPGTIAPGTIAPGTIAPGTIAPGTIAPGTIALSIIAPGIIAVIVVGAMIIVLLFCGLIYILKKRNRRDVGFLYQLR